MSADEILAPIQLSEPVEAYLSKKSSSVPRLTTADSNLINLAPGDPVAPVPEAVARAVEESVRNHRHGYTPPTGIEELRGAIAAKFSRFNRLDYALDEIVVGMGSKQVIVAALMATLRDGDEVIVATPSFSMYPDMVRLARGTPVNLRGRADADYKITARQLEVALTPKTRWILLNTPNNPTGAVYSKDELQRLADVVLSHPTVRVISDEIYEQLIYDHGLEHFSPARLGPDMRQRVFTVSGLSKTYGMTGWRIGYGAGPADLVSAIGAVQLLTTTCPPRVTQAAAIAALGIDEQDIRDSVDSLRQRRDMVTSALKDIPGVAPHVPSAALYVPVDCSDLLSSLSDPEVDSAMAIVNWLRTAHQVMVMPGELFDMDRFIRVSFCIPPDELKAGLDRLATGLRALAYAGASSTGSY